MVLLAAPFVIDFEAVFLSPNWTKTKASVSEASITESQRPLFSLGTQEPSFAAGTAAFATCLALGFLSASRRRPAVGRTARGGDDEVRQLKPKDRSDGHGWVKEDPEFDSSTEASVTATHKVELKKRPTGIKRYTHGVDGKGAMVMAMAEKGRYPGDPLGQAAAAGIKKGYVVKSVNGVDVRAWDFEDIMDLLEDFVPDPDAQSAAKFNTRAKRARTHQKVDFPATVEYMELSASALKSKASSQASSAPPGAWMPRLSGWSDEDLVSERKRVLAMEEPSSFVGPRYRSAADIDEAWLKTLLEFQRNGGNLAKKDAYLMVLDVINLLKKEKTLGEVQVKQGQILTVFGDIHGQYFDLLNMLEACGLPSADRPFLFNGDFVDRGSWSVEVILTIFAMKLKEPSHVFLNRGNHEMLEANLIYGFAGETGTKYDLGLFDLFSESFRNLPLLHLINKEILVVHAGLPGPYPRVWLPGQTHDPEDAVPPNERARTLEEIAAVDRYTELTPNSYKAAVDDAPRTEEKWETDTRMIIDFLWSDPRGGLGYGPSYRKSRGVFMFGPDITEQFCEQNKIKMVIRSHEVKAEGYLFDHPTLLSVFSAPNYLDTGGNKGAYLQISPASGRLEVKPTSFKAMPHPDLAPMHYQDFINTNHPHLTRTMKKKEKAPGDEFGDGDFAGYQAPDEWEEVGAKASAAA